MNPIDRALDKIDFKCTKCGAKMGACDCWQKCTKCGWSYEKGKKCRNPRHKTERK